jgi:hypothetical protein
MNCAYKVARREGSVDVDVYFECAAQACSRLSDGARRRRQQLERGRAERLAAAR